MLKLTGLRSHSSRTAENSATYLLPHLRPGQRLLDLGCGPGTITADLALIVSPGRVVAIDADPGVLEQAKSFCSQAGVQVEFHCATGENLPFGDGEFDVVHAHQVLQHVGDPIAVLREMRWITAPGGLVAARDGDYAGFQWFPQLPELDAWSTLYHRLATLNGGEPDAGRRLLSWSQAAGFTQIAAGASLWTFTTPSERAWWGTMWADRTLHSSFADQSLAEGLATRSELEAISTGWTSWAESHDGWLAVLHGEVLCRT